MKQRFINVKCFSSDGSVRQDLSVDHASVEGLMAVLHLAKVDDDVVIHVYEEEIPINPNGFPTSSKDA